MTYPLTNNHFIVQWGGTRLGFTEVLGLSVQSDSFELLDGANPEFVPMKMPRNLRYKNLVLKRHLHKGDNQMYEWFQTLRGKSVERRDLTISLLDENHEPLVVWKIRNAFPIKIEWSDLKASEQTVLTEAIEIAYEYLDMKMT